MMNSLLLSMFIKPSHPGKVRLPFSPAARRKDAIDAARPVGRTQGGLFFNCGCSGILMDFVMGTSGPAW